MITRPLDLTPELEASLLNDQDKVLMLFALSKVLPQSIQPGEIMRSNSYANLQRASSWEDIKTTQLDYAEQILDMFPENYEETNAFIQDITPLEGESLRIFLKEKCRFMLFPELNIAFCLDYSIEKKYKITQEV